MAPRPDQTVEAARDDEATMAKQFVSTETIEKETVIQVDGVLYDAMALANIHPGGELFVKAFGGIDASEAFLSYHRREFPHNKYTELKVGSAASKKTNKYADKEYLELCALVEQVLPRHKSFAPMSYYLKVFVILGLSVGLEVYIHRTAQYKWYLTAPLGLLFALIGLNVQHDANHGAVSRNPIINRALGFSQNWIGGSAVDWIHQHVVQHHVNTNDVDHDPDIIGNPYLRFNPNKPLTKIHGFQYMYMFVLLALFGFTYIADSFVHNTNRFHFTAYSKLLNSTQLVEQGTILFFVSRWLVLPFLLSQAGFLTTLLNVCPLFIVGGYYLSFFFVMSHNFEGVHMFDEKFLKDKEQSFLRKQAMTSSNVGGAFLCTINGGLNYQIEHHLFPRISHVHFPTIAPIVREFCKSRNIPYVHFPTIWDNFTSCSRHMYQMGSKAAPEGFQSGVTSS